MEGTHQEPRLAPRQRGIAPQVDVTDAAAAGELVLTIHIKTGHDASHNPGAGRAARPVGFRRAIAAAVLAVVDELMPFPSGAAKQAVAAGPGGLAGHRAWEAGKSAATEGEASQSPETTTTGTDGATVRAIPSATEPGQVDQLAAATEDA